MTNQFKESVAAGHFYSALPSSEDIDEHYARGPNYQVNGINFNDVNQLKLLEEFKQFYPPEFPVDKSPSNRYYYVNGLYSYTDAIMLYSMIRRFTPHNIIEIGSGFSSAVMLDTNEKYFDNKMNLTFIDPYQSRLTTLLKPGDRDNITILPEKVQSIDLGVFNALGEDDILFVDSTHVSKINSDVNRIIFDILPTLNKGVMIHFHDIFWPFVYPENWVRGGRAWNETYLLRAFLQFNDTFEIILFGDYIHKTTEWFKTNMPLTMKVTGGNIWLRKIK